MKILFIHQNFPGQYKHLAPVLARAGHDCTALTLRVKKPTQWHGVSILPYGIAANIKQATHPWLLDLDTKIWRAEACYRAAKALKVDGYTPDVILAHHGWGEAMFLRDLWPTARLCLYCELYHQEDGEQTNFDPEFPQPDKDSFNMRLRLKNLNNHLHFDQAQAGISPTRYQADTFPAPFRDKITVCHDGINTDHVAPNPDACLLHDGKAFDRSQEIITFINRNLEPYRGYHVFMRALPKLLKERPKAQILILGAEDVSYGARPPRAKHGNKSTSMRSKTKCLRPIGIAYTSWAVFPMNAIFSFCRSHGCMSISHIPLC